MKLVEPETAPLGKSAKKMFDPKLSLAAVGAGKAIFKFRKNRHVFGARRRRGHGLLHSKNKVNLTVLSDKGKEAVDRDSGAPALGRRLLEWLKAVHRNHDGDGRSLDHGDHETRDDRRSSS